MSFATGQILRVLGMGLEATSVLCMWSASRGDDGFWRRTGLDPTIPLGGMFLAGVALWITGLLVIRKHRRREREEAA